MDPLLDEKKHQTGWAPEKGPMNARGRLERIWAPRWSTLDEKMHSFRKAATLGSIKSKISSLCQISNVLPQRSIVPFSKTG